MWRAERALAAVESDLSNRLEGVPERFDPASMHGELTEAEHLARYAWAARLAPGKRVLDAGCGLGYGAQMLRRAGASEVVGVDLAESVVEAIAGAEEPGLSFAVGDVADLDFEDGRFDLVVCFEVIEHVHDQRRVIGELVRVLAEDGILAISSPNRASYASGNPHHVHEYLPQELYAALAEAVENVRLWRQHNWICSAVLDDAAFAASEMRPIRDLWVDKVVGEEPGRETYTLALASDGELPHPAPGAVITGTAEVRKWADLYDQQEEILRSQHEYFQKLEDRWEELRELRGRLAESERALARVPALEQERAEADAARDQALSQVADLRARAEAGERNLHNVLTSPSWRMTEPLRALKNSLKRALR